MSARLISQKIKFSEDEEIKIKKKKKNKNKDEFGEEEEQEVKYDIDLPVAEFHFNVETEDTSIAKTYETKNEMDLTLQIPKSEYKSESLKKLIESSNLPVQDEFYYRDIALNMVMAGDNQKTLLFSHGRITLKIKHNTKADYVTVEMVVKQKEDMYRGVVFGLDINSTYKRARKKILNPKTLNVIVPTVAAASGVVNTGIKNAVEVTGEEGQVVDESSMEFSSMPDMSVIDPEKAKKYWTVEEIVTDKNGNVSIYYNYAKQQNGIFTGANDNIDIFDSYFKKGFFPDKSEYNYYNGSKTTIIFRQSLATINVQINLSEAASIINYNTDGKYPIVSQDYDGFYNIQDGSYYLKLADFKKLLGDLGYYNFTSNGAEISTNKGVSIFPDPLTGKIQIDLSSPIINVNLNITNPKSEVYKQRRCNMITGYHICTITANEYTIPTDTNRISLNSYSTPRSSTWATSPRCFYDVYNPEYPWNVKLRTVIGGADAYSDISSTLYSPGLLGYQSPIPINVLQTTEQQLAGDEFNKIVNIGIGLLGLGYVGVAGISSDLIGRMAGTMGVVSFIAGFDFGKAFSDLYGQIYGTNEDAIIKNLNTKNEVAIQAFLKNRGNQGLTIDGSQDFLMDTSNIKDLTYAGATLKCYWACRVVYVLAVNQNVWVPCYSTFTLFKDSFLEIRGHDIYSTTGIIALNCNGSEQMTSDNHISGLLSEREKEIAKIIFAQLNGSETYWDTGKARYAYLNDAEGKMVDEAYIDYNNRYFFKVIDNL